MSKIEEKVISDFGAQWKKFDQAQMPQEDLQQIFESYFHVFPWDRLPANCVGADLGCGSGRWAKLVAPRVGRLYCIDPSPAIEVARDNLRSYPNCSFIQASADAIPLEDNSLDFGYSLGVLHHIPDTQAGIESFVTKLKPHGVLLLYLYYAFDNKPVWFRLIWSAGDIVRRMISSMPQRVRYFATFLIAILIYYPASRTARLIEKLGANVGNFPLSQYRNRSFYVIRTDAHDRFGTRFEQRFTRKEIARMLERSGMEGVHFSDSAPYWCVVSHKKPNAVG